MSSEQLAKVDDSSTVTDESAASELIEELKAQACAAATTVSLPEEDDFEEENTKTYVDPTDGTVYEWDEEKRAWFPKVIGDNSGWTVPVYMHAQSSCV